MGCALDSDVRVPGDQPVAIDEEAPVIGDAMDEIDVCVGQRRRAAPCGLQRYGAETADVLDGDAEHGAITSEHDQLAQRACVWRQSQIRREVDHRQHPPGELGDAKD
jgi:hypothetical protein